MFNRKILKHFEAWKSRKDRKPLILRGARQVGKTVSVEMFAKKHFASFIQINLEDPEHEVLFRDPVSLEDFERIVQIKFNQNLLDGETLVFIDEIQNSPALINLLRFFYEKRPALHVIAAGSLLEVRMKKEGFSFPVGRVEYAYLFPLNFFEFIEALGQKELLGFLTAASFGTPIPQAIADMASKYFNEYLIVGGMPDAVRVFAAEHDFIAVSRIHNSLLTSFLEDVPKYSSDAQAKYILHCLENAPIFAGQNVTYEHFGESSFRSREMSQAFDTLEKAMLVSRVMGCKEGSLPLMAKRKKSSKLVFLDIGLANYRLGIRDKIFGVKDLAEFYNGRIAEQVVGQQLLGMQSDEQSPIYYWYRDVPGSAAEVDYLFALGGKIAALEVKSGKSGRLRSLWAFVKASQIKTVFRVFNGQLGVETIQNDGQAIKLFSIPFFLLPRLSELIDQAFGQSFFRDSQPQPLDVSSRATVQRFL